MILELARNKSPACQWKNVVHDLRDATSKHLQLAKNHPKRNTHQWSPKTINYAVLMPRLMPTNVNYNEQLVCKYLLNFEWNLKIDWIFFKTWSSTGSYWTMYSLESNRIAVWTMFRRWLWTWSNLRIRWKCLQDQMWNERTDLWIACRASITYKLRHHKIL